MLVISIRMTDTKIIYSRSYAKIIDFVSMIGGLVSILLLGGNILIKPLVKISYQASLLNELLEFEFGKQEKFKKKKKKTQLMDGHESNNNNDNNNDDINDIEKD